MALSKEVKQKRLEESRRKKWNETHKIIDGVDYKLCSRCNEWLPSTQEYFHKNSSNGIDCLFPYCKECNIKKSQKLWRYNINGFRDKNKKFSKKRYHSIPEYRKEKIYQASIKREEGYLLEWQRNNKDKTKQYREKRQHKNHNITQGEWSACLEYFNNSCAYCGMSNEESKQKYNNVLHKEHVDDEGSNDLSNCVPSCKGCNSSKGTKIFEDWYDKLNLIFKEEKFNLIQQWMCEEYKNYISKHL